MIFLHTIFIFFFFNDTATTEIYTLSLHDALPICIGKGFRRLKFGHEWPGTCPKQDEQGRLGRSSLYVHRSEEHTSELQSQSNLVCRLLLEKKKNKENRSNIALVVSIHKERQFQ